METLVFTEPGRKEAEPYTTSDTISVHTRVNYRSVQRIIEAHQKRLEKFGIMRFEIALSGKAGRPRKVYRLNEQQATLLITFLKNTDVVADFKTELVRQFYAMREELLRRRTARTEGRPIRRQLTDVIAALPDGNAWQYKHFTDLAYKTVLGRNAAQLRAERGADRNAVAADFLTASELEAVNRRSYQIAVLLEVGMSYEQVKSQLSSCTYPACRAAKTGERATGSNQ